MLVQVIASWMFSVPTSALKNPSVSEASALSCWDIVDLMHSFHETLQKGITQSSQRWGVGNQTRKEQPTPTLTWRKYKHAARLKAGI